MSAISETKGLSKVPEVGQNPKREIMSKEEWARAGRKMSFKVQGFHIPSFKNGKVLFVTNPRNRELMRRIQASFEDTLLSWYPTVEGVTVTGPRLRSWIAGCGPEDDSCHFLIGCSWNFMFVPKGQEGADLDFESSE